MDKKSEHAGEKRTKHAIRIAFYILAAAALAVAIAYKKGVIVKKNSREVASFYNEWRKYGKPVTVFRAKGGDLAIYERTSAKLSTSGGLESYVPLALKGRLRTGQEAILEIRGAIIKSRIKEVSGSKDPDIGLYRVLLEMKAGEKVVQGEIVPAQLKTGSLKDVIGIPHQSIVQENGKSWVMKVKNGKAVRTKVKTSPGSADYDVIDSGVKHGDMVVVEGLSILKEGDKVRVSRCMNCLEASDP